MSESYSVGVDWSNGAWLCVLFEDAEYVDVRVEDEIEDLLEDDNEIEMILVDIPVGLFEENDHFDDAELVRECDAKARKALGRRHSSVFNPPARDAIEQAVDGEPYESVKKTSKDVTGKGLQKQAFHISKAIYEVDQLLREDQDLVDESDGPCVVESHPEVCFRALNGGDLSHSKKSAPGLAERLQAMEQSLDNPGETLYKVCEDLFTEGLGDDEVDVDIDDALDALVLAVVASAPEDEIQRLPNDEPPDDACGFPMQMVYRAAEPIVETS